MRTPSPDLPDAEQIIRIFDGTFAISEQTPLRGGASEPFYRPGRPHRIHFREDFARSALHEVAHWCIAGDARRQLADYGYWYSPDGRNAAQQASFFAVEARPQALESLFCDACGFLFSPSVDNVEALPLEAELDAFASRIESWRARFLHRGLPPRAGRFLSALQHREVRMAATVEAYA